MTNALSSLWKSYLQQLSTHPIRTKCITGGTLAALGDALAQVLLSDGSKSFDISRFLQLTVFGVICRPPMHVWYKRLDRVVPGSNAESTLAKLALDQLVFNPVFYVAWYAYRILLWDWSKGRGRGKLEKLVQTLRQSLWPVLMDNWKVWPVIMLVCFAYVPENLQVPFINIVGLLWNIFFSWRENSAKKSKTT
ncbi:putative inner mitochondrial membrane protein Mpv17/PMP22 superfamily member [Andalucia godoyi]|uniref:Putative inner mitochondrial membrane protein Mpv17/PMP22 superfamily member n=1 Tax=Andalucia godoyi TaxID=505711 RepID=A0A8K0AFW0_ANDGO|nr:putative inner mitochondrial membrane protein Mpv17/PMP22 superfamily member [Andalucia godoyi]|eukprot:ANDGO_07376.mRNA.1 putative inner mitochondrial membrane protein Mpv17/PMP22 superfamily member